MEASPGKAGDLHARNALRSGGRAARAGGEAGNPGKSSSAGKPGRPGSFAGHYGQLILTDGIAPIPRALYLYQGALNLSPQQVWFISYVLSHKWHEGLPHPRLQELARHASLGLRQIKNIKNSIVQAGLLEVTPRYDLEGGQDANSYDFGPLFDRLENLMVADPAAPKDELAEGPDDGERTWGETHDSDSADSITDVTKSSTEEFGRDYSFAARYGRVVLRRGVTALPRALFTYQGDLGLSPQMLWFTGYILSFQWSTEFPYPSLRKMARNTGYSERQIHRIKDDLVRAGYLRVIERRGADGRDTTSAYDLSELMKTLNTLLRKHSPQATGRANGRSAKSEEAAQVAKAQAIPQTSYQMAPSAGGGETDVSGGVNFASVGGEGAVSGAVNLMSEGGVNSMSVGRVNSTSYELESIKEETDKEEEHQQQPQAEMSEAQENAYYTLVDVGVIPTIALDLAIRFEPEHILGWVQYYLSVLSKQKNLDNPLGVLVKRLRSGDEPPCVPSQGDLHSLRLRMSWSKL